MDVMDTGLDVKADDQIESSADRLAKIKDFRYAGKLRDTSFGHACNFKHHDIGFLSRIPDCFPPTGRGRDLQISLQSARISQLLAECQET